MASSQPATNATKASLLACVEPLSAAVVAVVWLKNSNKQKVTIIGRVSLGCHLLSL